MENNQTEDEIGEMKSRRKQDKTSLNNNAKSQADMGNILKKPSRSKVWNHFELVTGLCSCSPECPPDTKHVKCLVPDCCYLGKYSGNTTNQNTHLSKSHPALWKEEMLSPSYPSVTGNLQFQSETSNKTTVAGAMQPKFSNAKKMACHRKLALWIVRRNRPLTISEKDIELREWAEELSFGAYQLPNKNQVWQQILMLENEGSIKVKEIISAMKSEGIEISIATDIWSENGVALLGLLGYAIVKVSEPQKSYYHMCEMLLAVLPFSELSHTGLNISTESKRILAQTWGIGEFYLDEENDELIDTVAENVFSFTADNASNMAKAFELFEGGGCFAHSLQLEVNSFFNDSSLKPTLDRVQGISTHLRQSTLGWSYFKVRTHLIFSLLLPTYLIMTDYDCYSVCCFISFTTFRS